MTNAANRGCTTTSATATAATLMVACSTESTPFTICAGRIWAFNAARITRSWNAGVSIDNSSCSLATSMTKVIAATAAISFSSRCRSRTTTAATPVAAVSAASNTVGHTK